MNNNNLKKIEKIKQIYLVYKNKIAVILKKKQQIINNLYKSSDEEKLKRLRDKINA